jgi:hypothetical protein
MAVISATDGSPRPRPRHAESGRGRAAEVQRDGLRRGRLDVAVRAADPVELAVGVERLGGGELAAQQAHELGGAGVAAVVVREVAVALLVQLVAAGDVVDGHPAAPGQLVQRGQLPGHQGRGDEPRPVGDQHLEPRGRVQHVRRNREPVGAGGVVADQDPVEPGRLVGLGEAGQVAGIDRRAVEGSPGLRDLFGAYHPDDFRGQGQFLSASAHEHGRAGLHRVSSGWG